MNAKFRYFLGEYICSVREAQEYLQTYTKDLHPLDAYHQKQIPAKGKAEGIENYCFDGLHWRVQLVNGIIVRFQYAGYGHISFNAKNLQSFAENRIYFSEYVDIDYVIGLLKEARENHEVISGASELTADSTCFLVKK